MGRGKVEVKRIEDKSNRQVTFSKRRSGLMKKARELSVLCDVDVAVHIFSGRGRLYEFTSGESLRKIFERFEGQRSAAEADSKSAHDPHEAKHRLGAEYSDMWTISDHLEMVQRQLEGQKVKQLNMAELTQIEHQLDALLQQTRIKKADQEPLKYSDILPVTGELADKPVAPHDAAMMQSAENMVLGQTQKVVPAAIVQSTATKNERAGLVAHDQVSDVASDQGVSLTETNLSGRHIVTESVGGQVVGQYVQCTPLVNMEELGVEVQQASITIGEALEATAQTAGDKPVDRSDAAAIQAAEVRATGTNVITPGGLAATAQSAATHNMGMTRDADKVKLAAILTNATMKLAADKVATRQDAETVTSAELRNNSSLTILPGGVAESVAAAARLNERTS